MEGEGEEVPIAQHVQVADGVGGLKAGGVYAVGEDGKGERCMSGSYVGGLY